MRFVSKISYLISFLGAFHIAYAWNFFGHPVRGDRNIFEDLKPGCCPTNEKERAARSAELAYKKYKCINEKEKEIAQKNNFFVTCDEDGTYLGACTAGCLHPSMALKVRHKETHEISHIALSGLYGIEKEYEVYAKPDYYTVPDFYDFSLTKCVSKPLRKIMLENDQYIITTDDHPFMLQNNQILTAKQLDTGFELSTEEGLIEINRIQTLPKDAQGVMNVVIPSLNQALVMINGIWTGNEGMQKSLQE